MARKKGIGILLLGTSIITLVVLSSCQGGFSLFATATPTPTNTFTPSPTSTPTQTPTITPSPTSTPIPTGRHVEQLANNDIRFFEYDLGYEMTFPSNWIPVPMQSDEQEAGMEKITAIDPSFGALEDAMLGLPGILAVKPTQGEVDLDILLIGISFEGEMFAAADLQDAMESQEVPEGAELLFKDTVTNKSGTEMGIIEWDDGETHTITTIFKTDKGMAVLSTTTPATKYDSVSQELVDLIGTVNLLEK